MCQGWDPGKLKGQPGIKGPRNHLKRKLFKSSDKQEFDSTLITTTTTLARKFSKDSLSFKLCFICRLCITMGQSGAMGLAVEVLNECRVLGSRSRSKQ